jgi:hypothetical protein
MHKERKQRPGLVTTNFCSLDSFMENPNDSSKIENLQNKLVFFFKMGDAPASTSIDTYMPMN